VRLVKVDLGRRLQTYISSLRLVCALVCA